MPGCVADGTPIVPGVSSTVRYRENAEAINGDGDNINLLFLAPAELQMEQLTVHWEAIPTTSEPVVLTKISIDGSRYDTVLRSVDPSTSGENLTDLVCVIPYRFAEGDTVRVQYNNTEDQDVGVEIMLVEV